MLAEPPKSPLHADNVTFAQVRRFYFEHHILPISRDKVAPKRAFALLVTYLNKINAQAGIEGAPRVGQFSLARQEGFMKWCSQQRGLSVKSISNYMSYVKAGLRFAARPRLILDARGQEREARLLEIPPFIEDGEARISAVVGKPRSQPRHDIPDDAQLAQLIDEVSSAPEHEATFRYIILALNTWARPEAILELSVRSQVDFNRGLVHLNPKGRIQNKKVRPSIRLTDNLRGWLLHWNLDHPITYFGRRVTKIDNRTLKKAAERAGLDPALFNRYTLRHYMATRVRRVEGVPVSREERAKWMGHTDPHHRTTEANYESFDPDYFVNAALATDAVMRRLDSLMRKGRLLPPIATTDGRLTVLKGGAA